MLARDLSDCNSIAVKQLQKNENKLTLNMIFHRFKCIDNILNESVFF